MVEHYNAFISYRHAPLDSKVAAMVQRSLERYRIPRKIQKESGLRRIDRIFRDKEELPITFNLNSDIDFALSHSDFLIVICSTSTHESQWVTKEIETFLRTHSRRQVLTVLADGEPYEVIPPILLYDEVERTLPNGETYLERIQLEPLSCDLRGDPRKAMHIELHRIAAPLLGCSFDELVQRQRRYQRRRLMTVMSSLVAAMGLLAAYFYWSSVQINESYLAAEANYQQSLKNQSRYLSAEALDALKSGDRLTALQLALEALPSEDSPRPLIPAAEYAVVKALLAYSNEDDRLTAVNLFTHQSAVTSFFTAQESRRLWVRDNKENLYLWDTQTFGLIRMWNHAELEADGIALATLTKLSDEKMLLSCSQKLRCMDASDGSILWERDIPNVSYLGIQLTPDGRELGFFSNADGVFYRLDARSGETMEIVPLYQEELPDGGRFTYSGFAYSPDGTRIAFCFSYHKSLLNMDGAVDCVGLYDIRAAQWQHVQLDSINFSGIQFTADGGLAVVGTDWQLLKESAVHYTNEGTYSELYTQKVQMLMLDAQPLRLRWRAERPYTMVTAAPSVNAVSLDDGVKQQDALCFCFSNKCVILEAGSGKALAEYELPASILAAQVDNQGINWILNNGEIARRSFQSDATVTFSVLAGEVNRAVKSDTPVFISSETYSGSENILMYDFAPADRNWERMEGNARQGYWESEAQNDDYYACIAKNQDNYHPTLTILDKHNAVCTTSCDLREGASWGHAYLCGLWQEYALVVRTGFSKERPTELLCFPLSGGEPVVTALECREDVQGAYLTAQDNRLFCLTAHEIHSVDLLTGAETVIPYQLAGKNINSFFIKNVVSNPVSAQMAMLAQVDGSQEYQPVVLELETGSITAFSSDGVDLGKFWAHYSPDGEQFAVPGKDCVRILSSTGVERCRIPADGRSASGVFFLRDGTRLGVLYSNKELNCYDTADGTLIQQTELEDMRSIMLSWNQVDWQEVEEDRGILLLHSSSPKALVLDLEDWDFCAMIDGCLTYLPERDSFVTGREVGETTRLGTIRRYSLPQLIEMAKTSVGTSVMTKEKRLDYGLE